MNQLANPCLGGLAADASNVKSYEHLIHKDPLWKATQNFGNFPHQLCTSHLTANKLPMLSGARGREELKNLRTEKTKLTNKL